MRKRLLAIIATVAMVMAMVPSMVFADTATTYFVSPAGNDVTGTGSEEKPFATIQRGIYEANEGDTVFVKEGQYNAFTPAGSTYAANSGRNQGLVINKGITLKAENKNTIIYNYIDSSVTTSFPGFDGRNTVIIAKSNGATIDGFTIYPTYSNVNLGSSMTEITGTAVNQLLQKETLYVYYNQLIYPIAVYNGGGQIDNLTIKNCVLGDSTLSENLWGSSIYLAGSYMKGSYHIDGNTYYGGIAIAGSAGGEQMADSSIINNHLYSEIALNGTRNNGWDTMSVTALPDIAGNTFHKSTATDFGMVTTYNILIRSCDLNAANLYTEEQLKTISEKNYLGEELKGYEIKAGTIDNSDKNYDDDGISGSKYVFLYIEKATNNTVPVEKPESSPNTGDNSMAPFAIAGIALAAMAAVVATRRRTN